MLNGTFNRIGHFDTDAVVANALIESFCVHARALFEFFDKTRGARKFTITTYKPFDGGDPVRREALTRKLNNQVSHVMDSRTAVASEKIGPADRAEMHSLLNAEFKKFEAGLSPAYAAPAVSSPTFTIPNVPHTATNHVVTTSTNMNTLPTTKP